MATGTSWLPTRVWNIALAAVVVGLLYPFVAGLLGAGVLYVLCAPLLRRVTSPARRRVSAFALMFLTFFALVLPGLWLADELLAQVPEAVRQLQGSAAVQTLMAMQLGDMQVGAILRQATSDIVSWSSRQTVAAVSSAMDITLNLVVSLFGTYYLLTAHEALWPRIRARLPMPAATAEQFRVRFYRVTEAMVLGVVFAAVAQGVLVGLAFRALGLPNSLLWGSVTAVVSVLPIFGSALVWLPAAGVLMAHGRAGAAVFLLAFGALVVSNIDNALRLVVYQRVSQIHPMITLVGAFAGVKALGIAGLLLGPLVLSYAIELVTLNVSAPVGVSPGPTSLGADTEARAVALT